MTEKSKEIVFKIVSKITNKNITNINLNADIKNELTLDSIKIIELFAQLEKEFEIELPLKLLSTKTGNEFFRLLEISIDSTENTKIDKS